jgi:hypothetical protein
MILMMMRNRYDLCVLMPPRHMSFQPPAEDERIVDRLLLAGRSGNPAPQSPRQARLDKREKNVTAR